MKTENLYFKTHKVVNTGRTRFKKGCTPWNKGVKKPVRRCSKCNIEIKRYGNNETCMKCRDFTWGDKISEALKGKPNLKVRGKNHGLWKDGITPIHNKIRGSIEYKLWQNSVFARDGYTCQKTGTKGCKLAAHHIKNFAQYPELHFTIDNGITLSKESHELFHYIYGKKNNIKEQLTEFLND